MLTVPANAYVRFNWLTGSRTNLPRYIRLGGEIYLPEKIRLPLEPARKQLIWVRTPAKQYFQLS